jgi:hypothetical protein
MHNNISNEISQQLAQFTQLSTNDNHTIPNNNDTIIEAQRQQQDIRQDTTQQGHNDTRRHEALNNITETRQSNIKNTNARHISVRNDISQHQQDNTAAYI